MNIIQSGFLTSIPVIVSKRVLAGPHSIQIFGSLGVGIIKIGRFIRGGYTRRMAPHYLQRFDGFRQAGNDSLCKSMVESDLIT